MQNLLSLQYPFILASNSPRRKEILRSAGFDFTVLPSDVDESFSDEMKAQEVPVHLAERKANELARISPNALVLAADTVVILENEILNKPLDKFEAIQMLQKLSGKTHEVVTGIALHTPQGLYTKADSALVKFRTFEEWEIDFYVKEGSCMDKAGSYGVQDYLGMVGIESIQGSFYTVMGLPIYEVYQLMKPYILDGKQLLIR
jgi:septum formation protein